MAELKVEGLAFSFGTQLGIEGELLKTDTPSAQPVPNHEQQNKDAIELEELRFREEQLATMLLENPLEYERLVAEGDLIEDDEDGDEDMDERSDGSRT